jgi:hypothetical protein
MARSPLAEVPNSTSNIPITPSRRQKSGHNQPSTKQQSALPKKRAPAVDDQLQDVTPRRKHRQEELVQRQEAIESTRQTDIELAEKWTENDDETLEHAASATTVSDSFGKVLNTLPRAIQMDDNHPLAPIRDLVASLQRYSRGEAILPDTLKV